VPLASSLFSIHSFAVYREFRASTALLAILTPQLKSPSFSPCSIDRTFKLRTDKPSLLTLRDPRAELQVAAKASQYISLRFSACQRACTQEILLFVNDEDDKNEECLCISVTYY
jgi:hypothetical protein